MMASRSEQQASKDVAEEVFGNEGQQARLPHGAKTTPPHPPQQHMSELDL